MITVPGGFDGFFAAAGTPAPRLTLPPPPEGPPDTRALIAHALAYGCEILGPPLGCAHPAGGVGGTPDRRIPPAHLL